MPATVISSRAGARSGNTCSRRPVSRSPTIAVPSGSTTRPVGTFRSVATTLGSPATWPDPGSAGWPGAGAGAESVGGPTSGGAPCGMGRQGPFGTYPSLPQAASAPARVRAASSREARPAVCRLTPFTVRAAGTDGSLPARAAAARTGRLTSAAVADTITGVDIVGPDDTLRVLVPSTALVGAVEALSPRVRAYRFDPADGLPAREAAQARVLVPRGGGSVPDELFAALPDLRMVQLMSAGAERFVGRLPEGVVLCNARGAHTPSTAEWAVTATLAAQRGVPEFVRAQEAGRWSPSTQRSLVGARVLIVGAGDIGQAIGRMMAGFDVELTYVARTARDGIRSTEELPELLPDADVVVLIVPVTPETTGMVDARLLAAMKDGALLVNAARGVLVDTDALVAELQSGRLRAALDVTEPEPLPEGHPLWSAPGLLLTPHVAGAVPDTNDRAAAAVLDQLTRVLEGRPLVNVVGDY